MAPLATTQPRVIDIYDDRKLVGANCTRLQRKVGTGRQIDPAMKEKPRLWPGF
jgi:hypothetical protein